MSLILIRLCGSLLLGGLLLFCAVAEVRAQRGLEIYFLDMHGGGATLVVTPSGESILIDTGSFEPEHRDADRILAAARDAGLDHLDYLITTHFHSDHFGAIAEVARRLPVRRFLDKGALPPERDEEWFRRLYPMYLDATGGRAGVLRAGDEVPLRADPSGPPLRLRCLAAEKQVVGFSGDIDRPVEGYRFKAPDGSDNARSIALQLSYGDFDFFAGADITWNVEHHLAVPPGRVGPVDLYQVTHHGLDQSNNPVLLRALAPTVAVSMNGPNKGIQTGTLEGLRALPTLQALYQLHYNAAAGEAGNTSGDLVANPEGSPGGAYVKVVVAPDARQYSVQIGPDGTPRVFTVR